MSERVKEEELLENEQVRQKFLGKIDELEKIKKLILLPNTELMTTKAVSEWFEVEFKTIQKLFERNRSELKQNGVVFKKYSEIKNLINTDNMSALKISRRGTNVYTKRALLNVGMLLRDSVIARQLRNNILDTYEAAPDEIKLNGVETEKDLAVNVLFSGTDEDRLKAMKKYKDFKDQHINQLEKVITEQEPKVKIHDQLVASVNVSDILIIAKNIGVGEKKLFEFLRATGILFKQGEDNVPYQQYQNSGLFEVRTMVRHDKYNREFRYYTTKVTGKGKIFIANLVDKYGGAEIINDLKLKEIDPHVKKIKENQ